MLHKEPCVNKHWIQKAIRDKFLHLMLTSYKPKYFHQVQWKMIQNNDERKSTLTSDTTKPLL